jgi:hypothetical protein
MKNGDRRREIIVFERWKQQQTVVMVTETISRPRNETIKSRKGGKVLFSKKVQNGERDRE